MTSTDPVHPLQPEPLWTVRDVQALLRIGRNHVYDLANRGVLPSIRIGSRVRFDPAKIRAWLEAQSAGAKVLPFTAGGR
jgi:excisionase family DNA binding protein